jgi:osmotically-inducible protein OsmY
MDTDIELQRNVMDGIVRASHIDSAHIGVCVEGGVVTLSGHVDTFAEKETAGRTANSVPGVTAVANEIEVGLLCGNQRSDFDIARMAAAALGWDYGFPCERVKLLVSDGWITLEGSVGHPYQRREAEEAIRFLTGVKGVHNNIAIIGSEAMTEVGWAAGPDEGAGPDSIDGAEPLAVGAGRDPASGPF